MNRGNLLLFSACKEWSPFQPLGVLPLRVLLPALSSRVLELIQPPQMEAYQGHVPHDDEPA